jgi:hypothetical protein
MTKITSVNAQRSRHEPDIAIETNGPMRNEEFQWQESHHSEHETEVLDNDANQRMKTRDVIL